MEEIIFADTDIETLKANSKELIESFLNRKLSDSDPLWLFTCALLSLIVQQRQIINTAANQNLLAFATNENLEKLGELVGIERHDAAAAFTTVEITLSTARNKQTIIPAGTRVSTAEGLIFKLAEDVIFLSGETIKTAKAICQTEGEIGNNFKVGEISRIIDYAPYLKSISNVTISEGGADIETDDELRERIRQAPESFSVAGSKGAYEFWTKDFSTEIIDAYVESPTPGVVDVYFLLEGGNVPQSEMLSAVYSRLSADTVRPLTDYVRVFPPEIVNYDVDLKYYISRQNATQATSIISNAEKAVDDFILWQKSKLGRDIEPSELIRLMRNAGADRIIVNQPEFLAIPPNAVAICSSVNVVYNGLKDV